MKTSLEDQITTAKNLLNAGDVVAFPTETIYGLGGNVFDEGAVKKIFALKKRPSENPLIAHIGSLDMLSSLVTEISPLNQMLIDAFWPGPLSILFPKRPTVPAVVTAGLETIVVRFPAHPVAQKLILECGFPLAAPSVNPSGKPSSTHHQHVLDYFEDSLFVIADNSSSIGLESTVISTLVDPPVILRQGAITKEDIEQVIHLPVLLVSHSSHQKPLSPGQKFRHYSPKAPIEIIPLSPTSSIEVNIHQKALEHLSFGRKVGALIAEETTPSLPSDVVSFVLGPRDNLSLISSRLYAGLHNFDLTDVDIILVESFPEDGLGATIMDRFYRAAQIH